MESDGDPTPPPTAAPESAAAVEDEVTAAAVEEVAEDAEDVEGEEEEEGEEAESEDEALLSRAQRLISKITAAQENPNPRQLHALASLIEAQESRYLEESGNSSLSNGRASHSIGKLGNLVRENDGFYELLSSKFLAESGYSVGTRAAAARVILGCSSTWMLPHVFEDAVLDNIKSWVMEDPTKFSGDGCDWKREFGVCKPSDSEMLKTYGTGLLAMSLPGGSHVVEDILTSGLSAKLMRFLRTRVLGELNVSQKDASVPIEVKHASSASTRGNREEHRGRLRQISEASRLDVARTGNEGLFADHGADRDRTITSKQAHGEECWEDGVESLRSKLTDSSSEVGGTYGAVEVDPDLTCDDCHNMDLPDGKSIYGERHVDGRAVRDANADECVRDDSSKRRVNRVVPRIIGRVKLNESTVGNERPLTSPSSALRSGGLSRGSRDKSLLTVEEMKFPVDVKKNRAEFDGILIIHENDERFRECNVGSRDISDMVKKATRAAEAEAQAANAPVEAIKAAGDAAAELVKTAALEVWRTTNDEEAAVLAASVAASTVVDAAIATEVSRNSPNISEKTVGAAVSSEVNEEVEEFYILDDEPLARLREKCSIQCLETLGEYVEALAPVLNEKGVDVCLALLQRSLKDEEASANVELLPEVLKLICALAAHRKFAAVFVDRHGIQKLFAVQRVSLTYFGLSSCLFTIGSLQGIMERVCALPSDVVHRLVELALQLLECPQDQARKNAAIFFASAFVFRAILDSFDAQDGLQIMLNLLHGAASVRSGGNSGTLGMPNAALRNDGSPAEVLTASEKQIAYHTCVALRQYFRAHFILLVDSLRPNKTSRGITRGTLNARAYKPIDISNEAMDAVFVQLQRDRKIGPAFVRARWPAVDKFLASNGHITMLELCQAPPVERYLHDLAQYALGVLHIVTFVPNSRKLVVNATLSNNRVGMAVILDAANAAGYVDPEVIHPALSVLVNLVCPPPSISNKPSVSAQSQHAVASHINGPATESRERHSERNISDRFAQLPSQHESHERNGESNLLDRVSGAAGTTPHVGSSSQATSPAVSYGVVGDRRISLGPGSGGAGVAAQLEQGYHEARVAVRANNGIKVLLRLLDPRMITSPATLDCLRALACRVLLGLARDDTIAHILTKLQVGKKLSELIRDSGTQTSGTEQARWHSELAQVAIELIAIVTNSGRASTLAATDAAAPTLRRIERASIAAATPITYHSRELLLLIHEHLQASGLGATATLLQKEADLTPLPSSTGPPPILHQTSLQETTSAQPQWPSGRVSGGFLSSKGSKDEDIGYKPDLLLTSSKRKPSFSSSISQGKSASKISFTPSAGPETPSLSALKTNADVETPNKTPILLPMKRKQMESKDPCTATPAKRHSTADFSSHSSSYQTPLPGRKNILPTPVICPPRDAYGRSISSSVLVDNSDDFQYQNTPGVPSTTASHLCISSEQPAGNVERMTLDSLVVQYLKHQHRQCPAPISTLPPLSLLHPHVCPEPSHNLNAPINVTARVGTREFRQEYGGIQARRRDRQFVYSRFRPCRICRDDSSLLTCLTFLGSSSRIATGSHSGELKLFDSINGNLLETHSCHQTAVTLVQSALFGDTQMLLSSGTHDVRLWDAFAISSGPLHLFEGCKGARFSNSGSMLAATSTEPSRREVILYDIQTSHVVLRLPDSTNANSGPIRGHAQSQIHFSPSDTMLLWNGFLWDRRSSGPVHRFDQFTDYGGGGFHPAGNEVIINSEVWDLRKFKLLRSVPSLDQTVITFNSGGDVIYAILRRNLDDITSAVNTRRVRHPLFPAFRTIDAVNYSEIATFPVDRCVLDFAADPTDTFVGVIAMDDSDDMYSSGRLFEIGRRRPTDDDSDPDDGVDTDEDEDDEDNDGSEADDMAALLGTDISGDGDTDASNDDDDDDESGDDGDEDADFNIDDADFDGGQGLLEMMAEGEDGEDDDSDLAESFSSGDEEDFLGNGFRY